MGLDTVEIVMELETDFGISIPDALASRCVTVRDLQDVILDLLVATGRPRTPGLEQEVWNGLVLVITEQMRMKPEAIHPESRWVGDITRHG